MPNITLSIDEKTLRQSREYARKHNLSLNALIRQMLEQKIGLSKENWVGEFLSLSDSLKINSNGYKWAREDIYDL